MGDIMDLLFKREQSAATVGRVNFKLWGKIELNEDEQALVKRYRFDDAVLIAVEQPGLLRNSIIVAFVVGMIIVPFSVNISPVGGPLIGVIVSILLGYFYFHQKRETIFVKDLLHGRHFACKSVVELARKEAWLAYVVSFLRQVMESAKHWDGTERHTIEPLPKDEARQVIIRGL